MAKFQVVVSNVGSVGECINQVQATALYWQYVRISKRGIGKAAGESVTLFKNGEPFKEYYGEGPVEKKA